LSKNKKLEIRSARYLWPLFTG